MQTVRTEKTSKGIKGAMVLGVVAIVASACCFYQGIGGQAPAYGAAAGACVYIAAKGIAWWQYG